MLSKLNIFYSPESRAERRTKNKPAQGNNSGGEKLEDHVTSTGPIFSLGDFQAYDPSLFSQTNPTNLIQLLDTSTNTGDINLSPTRPHVKVGCPLRHLLVREHMLAVQQTGECTGDYFCSNKGHHYSATPNFISPPSDEEFDTCFNWHLKRDGKTRRNQSSVIPSYFNFPGKTLHKCSHKTLVAHRYDHDFNVHYCLSLLTYLNFDYGLLIERLRARKYFVIHGNRINLVPYHFINCATSKVIFERVKISFLSDNEMIHRLRIPRAQSGALSAAWDMMTEISRMPGKVNSAVDKFTDFSTTTEARLGMVFKPVEAVLENDGIRAFVNDPKTCITEVIGGFMESCGRFLMSPAAITFYALVAGITLLMRMPRDVWSLGAAALSVLLGGSAITHVLAHVRAMTMPKAQGPSETGFWTLAAVVLGSYLNIDMPSSKLEGFSRLAVHARTASSLLDFFTKWAVPFFESFMAYFFGYVSLDGLTTDDLKKCTEAIEFYNKKCDVIDVIKRTYVDKIDKDRFSAEVLRHCGLLKLVHERLMFKNSVATKTANANIAMYVGKYQKLINEFTALGFSAVSELSKQPFILQMKGKPRTGKSSLVNIIVEMLLCSIGRTFDASDIYSRQLSEYWENYSNQFCVLFDDFGALVDTASSPNPNFVDLLLLGSDLMKPLNMADITGKGRTFFTSELVILTNNVDYCPKSLSAPTALRDRVTLKVEVVFAQPSDEHDKWFVPEEETTMSPGPTPIKPRHDCPHEIYDLYARYRVQHFNTSLSCNGTAMPALGTDLTVLEFLTLVRNAFMAHRNRKPLAASRAIHAKKTYAHLFVPFAQSGKCEIDDEICYGSDIVPEEEIKAWEDLDIKSYIDYPEKPPILKAFVPDELHAGGERTSGEECEPPPSGVSSNCPTDAEVDSAYALPIPAITIPQLTDRFMQVVLLAELGGKMAFSAIKENFVAVLLGAGVLLSFFAFKKMFDCILAPDVPKDAEPYVGQTASESVASNQKAGMRNKQYRRDDIAKGRFGNGGRDYVRLHATNYPKTRAQGFDPDDKNLELVDETGEISICEGLSQKEFTDFDNIVSIFVKNTRYLSGPVHSSVDNKYHLVKFATVVFICGTTFLVPKHSWAQIQNIGCYSITGTRSQGCSPNFDGWRKVCDTESVAVTEPDGSATDLMLVRIGNSAAYASILKHFAADSDWSGLSRNPSDIFLPFIRKYTAGYDFDSRTALDPRFEGGKFEYLDSKMKPIHISRRISYMASSTYGDCGTPVVSCDKKPRVLGVHVYGHIDIGAYATAGAVFVSSDMLRVALKKMSPQSQSPAAFTTSVGNAHFYDTQIPVVGIVDKDKRGFVMRKSSIRPSPLHGKIPSHQPCQLPARLTPVTIDGVKVDPFVKGFDKMNEPNIDIDMELINEAIGIYFAEHCAKYTPDPHPLSYEEACYPPARIANVSPINLSTSSGFGHPKGDGKRSLIGPRDNFSLDSGVKATMDDFVAKAHDNEVVVLPFVASMKDERRPPEKVAAAKTRLFSAAMVEFIVLFRAYFLPVLSYLRTRRLNNGIAVGTNYYSVEWDQIANMMLKFGENAAVAGDFTGFDGSLQQPVVVAIGEMLIKMCDTGTNENDQRVRRALWYNISHSVHIADIFVLVFGRGNPSGCPITTELNSIYNVVSTIYAYIRVCARGDQFFRDVVIIAYGDDNLIAINPNSLFTIGDLQAGYAELGLKFTAADKKSTPKLVNLRDLRFLKRGFVFDQEINRWLCPLEHSAIEDMINWSNDGKTSTFVQVLESALFEESLHGREKYESFCAALTLELKKSENLRIWESLRMHSFMEMRAKYFVAGHYVVGDGIPTHY